MKAPYLALAGVLLSAVLTLTAADKKGEWIQLFDGKTLEGWVDSSGKPVSEGWEISDGAIHRTGKATSLYSARQFKDMELEFDWKIAPGANSGLKYRFKTGVGPEYQMIDEKQGKDLKPLHLTGDLYDVKGAEGKRPARPAGEWNTSRIVAKGNHLEHWLNGEKLLEIEIDSPEWNEAIANSKFKDKAWFGREAGPIMLQDHGDEVWFKNLRVREL